MNILLTTAGLPLILSNGVCALPKPPDEEPATDWDTNALMQSSSIEHRGATFNFSTPVWWFASANGDPVVISHATYMPSGTTITSISPASTIIDTGSDDRRAHGTMINPKSVNDGGAPATYQTGFDGFLDLDLVYTEVDYIEAMNDDPEVAGPIAIATGDAMSVVKSIRSPSRTTALTGIMQKVVERYVVLTVMPTLPPRAGTWWRPGYSSTTKAWPNRPLEEVDLTGGESSVLQNLPTIPFWDSWHEYPGDGLASDWVGEIETQHRQTIPIHETTWDPGRIFKLYNESGTPYAGAWGKRYAPPYAGLFFDPGSDPVEIAARETLAIHLTQHGIDLDAAHQEGQLHSTGAGQWYGYTPAHYTAAFVLGDAAMLGRAQVHRSGSTGAFFWVAADMIGFPCWLDWVSAGSSSKPTGETYQIEDLGKPEWTHTGWENYDINATDFLAVVDNEGSDRINASFLGAYRDTQWDVHPLEILPVCLLRNGPIAGEDGVTPCTGEEALRFCNPVSTSNLRAASLAYIDRSMTITPILQGGVGPHQGPARNMYNTWRDYITTHPRWTGAPDIQSQHTSPNFSTGSGSGAINWSLASYNMTTQARTGIELQVSQDGRQFYNPAGGAAISLASSTTTHSITGLRPGTVYWCRWRQQNASGWSKWSQVSRQFLLSGGASASDKLPRNRATSSGTAPSSGSPTNTIAPQVLHKPYPLHEMPVFEPATAPAVGTVLYAGMGHWTGGNGALGTEVATEADIHREGTYQWQRDAAGGTSWTNVSTSPSYTIPAGSGATIRCVVTVNGVAANSNAVTVA